MEPAADPPELKRARALWQANRHDEACALFAELADRHSASPAALADAARAFGQRYEIRRAEAYLDRLRDLAGGDPSSAFLAGQSFRMIHREDKALACLTEFVRGAGRRHAAAHLELAVLHERRHRIEPAAEAAATALKLDPGMVEALVIQARLFRRTGQPGRARTVLRRAAAHSAAHPFTRAQAWAALAALADDEGDYADAVALMERCKAILRPFAALPERQAAIARGSLESFGQALTRDDFRRWQADRPDNSARVAHLTGFPRSGTTLLENILDAHPGLTGSEEREVFARDLAPALWNAPGANGPPTVAGFDALPAGRRADLRRRYFAAMEEAADEPIGDRVHLDKNPAHTPFVPALVRLFPESRFLVALRDPRDVVVSCWFQFLPPNPNSVAFLSWESATKRYALDLGLWLRWRGMLEPDSWREVRYEDVVRDLESEARRALEFLGLPWDDAVLRYRDRIAAKIVRTPTYVDVARPVHSAAIGRWKHYLPHLEPHLSVLAPVIGAFGYD